VTPSANSDRVNAVDVQHFAKTSFSLSRPMCTAGHQISSTDDVNVSVSKLNK